MVLNSTSFFYKLKKYKNHVVDENKSWNFNIFKNKNEINPIKCKSKVLNKKFIFRKLLTEAFKSIKIGESSKKNRTW